MLNLIIMTQNEIIKQCLLQGDKLTAMYCFKKHGVMRLASRICDLRSEGLGVSKKMIAVKNRSGKTVYVAEYKISN